MFLWYTIEKKGPKMEGYLTIAEFAKQANITRQAVYQRIEKELLPFVKIIDNKKYINSSALIKFTNKKAIEKHEEYITYQDNQNTANIDSSYCEDTSWIESPPPYVFSEDLNVLLNEMLTNQQEILILIKEKDKQIQELQEENKIYKEKTSQQSDTLARLLEQSQQLLIHNQLVIDKIFSVKNEKSSTTFEKLKDKIEQAKTNLFNS